MVNLFISSVGGSRPQGILMDKQAKEDGESEYASVIEVIGIEYKQHCPMRKHAHFHLVLYHKKACYTEQRRYAGWE
jgi:hypothetical protein